MNIREKFLLNNIPYDEIDPEMIDILDVLNFNLELKTKYCCYGHEERTVPYVVFDESVTDDEIQKLANQTGKFYLQIVFKKWVRHYPVLANWTLELGVKFKDPNSVDKKVHMGNVVECLGKCNLK